MGAVPLGCVGDAERRHQHTEQQLESFSGTLCMGLSAQEHHAAHQVGEVLHCVQVVRPAPHDHQPHLPI